MTPEPEILFERRGAAGLVTLNRPQALNALTHGMVRAMMAELAAWARDPAIACVVVQAAGERAFCAGGDIRALHDLGRSGQQDRALQFWRDEYVLNTFIRRYPKPYLCLMDGIVMGGGAGISVNGAYRVAGAHFQFAMPEVSIGFFPDVGASWFLSRMPGETGTYCALTGERLKTADALATGIATHAVPKARWPGVLDALAAGEPAQAVLNAQRDLPGPAPIGARRAAIDRLFAHDRVEDILVALDGEVAGATPDAGFAGATAALIRAKSPLSLKIALAQVRRGRHMSFPDCMRMEFRIVSRVVYGHDFYEGVRAVLVDKDQRPQWSPRSLDAVSDAEVERHFEPLEVELAVS